MSQYDTPWIEAPTCSNTSIKRVKIRLKQQQKVLKDFLALVDQLDMSWENRTQVIGQLYWNIRASKKEIKHIKLIKKKNKG